MTSVPQYDTKHLFCDRFASRNQRFCQITSFGCWPMTARIYALPDEIFTQTDFEFYQQLLHQQQFPGEEVADTGIR